MFRAKPIVVVVAISIATWVGGRGATAQETAPAETKADSAQGSTSAVVVLPEAEQLAMKTIRAALTTRVSVDFHDEPLDQCLASLAAQLSPPTAIVIDRKGLDDVGIGSDAPVTLTLASVTAEEVLRQISRQLGLGYGRCGETLVVSSEDEAEQARQRSNFVVVYAIDDLLDDDEEDEFDEDEEDEDNDDNEEAAEKIVDLVQQAIDPETWSDLGGVGVATIVDDALVVAQTERVHQKLEMFLQALRRVRERD